MKGWRADIYKPGGTFCGYIVQRGFGPSKEQGGVFEADPDDANALKKAQVDAEALRDKLNA